MKPKRILGWLTKGAAAMTLISDLRVMWPAVRSRIEPLAANDPAVSEFVGTFKALIALFHRG